MLPSGCFMRYLISSMFITNFDNRFYWFSENMIWQRWFPGCAVTVSFPFLLCVCLNYSNLTFIYTTFSRSPIIYSLVGVARASDSFDLQSISMSASVFGSLRLFFFFAFAHWLFSSPLDHYNNHHHHYFRGRSLCFGRFGSIRKGDFLILCVILQSKLYSAARTVDLCVSENRFQVVKQTNSPKCDSVVVETESCVPSRFKRIPTYSIFPGPAVLQDKPPALCRHFTHRT